MCVIVYATIGVVHGSAGGEGTEGKQDARKKGYRDRRGNLIGLRFTYTHADPQTRAHAHELGTSLVYIRGIRD